MGDPTRVVGRRVIAFLLDGIILTVVFFGVAAALGVDVVSDPISPSGWEVEGSDTALAMTAILPFAYFVLVNVAALAALLNLARGRRIVRW